MSIIQQRTFNVMMQSFKRFFKTFDKTHQYADQIERKDEGRKSRDKQMPYSVSISLSGGILAVVSFLVSLIYW